MVCNRCVEKFDHHCVYINNCLGHRNHKYFMLFLLLISLYFLSSTATSVASFITHSGQRGELAFDILDWLIRVYTVTINALLFIPLGYQLREQLKKLCKKEVIERANTVTGQSRQSESRRQESAARSRVSSKNSSNQNELFMKESLMSGGSNTLKSNTVVRRGCCYNLRTLFCFRPATQDQLRAFLFSDSERYSTFVIKQERIAKL
jgi:hypothetical protein